MKIGDLKLVYQPKIIQEELKEILERFPNISKHNVNMLIRYSERRYIVWLDNENEFDWQTTESYDYENNNRPDFNRYIARIGVLLHHPTAKCLSKKQYKEFNCMLAETVVLVLEKEFDEVEKQITEIEAYLNERNCEISRKWQLESCFCILLFLFIALIFIKHNYSLITNFLDLKIEMIQDLSHCLLGTVGASLSIIQKTGKKCYDCKSGRFLNFLEIFSRMFVGVIGGILVLYLYKAEFIFAGVNQTDTGTYISCVLSIIAGFSERLVPSIISKFENDKVQEVIFYE